MPPVPLLQMLAKAAAKVRSEATDALEGMEQPGKRPPDQQNRTDRRHQEVHRHILHGDLLPSKGDENRASPGSIGKSYPTCS